MELSACRRVIYLHGFASSPQSRKARFFAERLHADGFTVEIPDLANGDFEHLTLSGQLRLVEGLLRDGRAILIGSSLGGYLSALSAARHPEVEKLILLAPAFGFYDLWKAEMGEERFQSWRENGTIPVFHYGEGRELPLSFDLMEDAAGYESFPDFVQPALIFHGVDDPVVPVANSRRYAAGRPNIHLLEFRSGHELTDVLDDMWLSAREFLLAGGL
jgi:pimeloyl-ACP methyl ester carboxylesterase